MKKFLSYISFYFILPYVIILCIYQLTVDIQWDYLQDCQKKEVNSSIDKINNSKQRCNIIIGDSRAADGIIPFNDNWYNLSIHGSDFVTVYYYLSKIKPELIDTIIISCCPFNFNSVSHLGILEEIIKVDTLELSPSLPSGIKLFDDHDYIREYIFSKKVIDFKKNIINRSNEHQKKYDSFSKYGIWCSNKKDGKKASVSQDEFNSNWKFEVNAPNEICFNKIVNRFGKSYLVYSTSPHSENVKEIDQKYFKEFENFVAPKLNKTCFYHFERLPHDLFSDGSHMNFEGAKIWSQKIRNDLAK